MKKTLFVLSVLLIASFAMTGCLATEKTYTVAEIATIQAMAPKPADAAQAPAAAPHADLPLDVATAKAAGSAESAPAVQAPIVEAPAWDITCKSQSNIVGVALTPLKEGPATACIWTGSATTVTIPASTFADLDLGGIFIAQGPSAPISGVGRLTLRQWISGNEAELCAHKIALNSYLKTQPGHSVASEYNFGPCQ